MTDDELVPYKADHDFWTDMLEQQRILIAQQRALIEIITRELAVATTRVVRMEEP